jgi:TPR repeat protein
LASSALAVRADDYDDKKVASSQIGVSDWAWDKGETGNMMTGALIITNNSDWDIKDMDIEVTDYANSGTDIGAQEHTIYEIVPAHSVGKFAPIDFGYVDPRTMHAGAEIKGFDFCQPHLSLEEMKLAKAKAEKIAATNAVLAKAAAEQRKKIGEAAALKFNQDAAAKGDAYGLFRMGERYRDGDGFEKDLAKSKDYFQKSAVAGNQDVALALKNLSE